MDYRPPFNPEAEMALPFPGASGRGVRVAVIDSGVNPQHPHISGIAGGASVFGAEQIEEGCFLDTLGHGTAVMAAIQEKAPEAEYLAVKLFQRSLRASSTTLLAAIEWALAQSVDVINLSLGTTNLKYQSYLQEVVENAASRGTILVSARETDGRPCLPGSLAGVIGVRVDWDSPRARYRVTEEGGGSIYYASGYPRTLPGLPRERNLNGISFAVANMTGFVIRARESFPANALAAALASEARRSAQRPAQDAERS
jgi:subtilisin family serine protease